MHVSRQQHPRLSGLTNAITATRKTTLDRDSFETILGSWLDTYFGPEPVAEEIVTPEPEPVLIHRHQVLASISCPVALDAQYQLPSSIRCPVSVAQ